MPALHDIITKDSTDRSVVVKIADNSDGTPETSVVWNSAGIDMWYRREGGALVSITEATLASLTTTHSDGGFLHISDGDYRLDLPDAAYATGANYVDFGGAVTGMVVIGGRVRLVDVDLEDATRMGLAALPNANAEDAGGLIVSTLGTTDADDCITATSVGLNTGAVDAAALATDAVQEIVDGVLDEVNTSGAHNVNNSVGKQIREGTAAIAVSSGTCQATGQTTTNVRIAASENSTDDVYTHKRIVFTDGTNAAFDAIVTSYDGTNKDCTISPALSVACDNTTDYEIVAAICHTETQRPGYGDAIHIDTVSGTAGTELYVNGTIDNPVDSIADASTLLSSLNFHRLEIADGSNITLAQGYTGVSFMGGDYTMVLGGQALTNCDVSGARLSGACTGTVIFERCIIDSATTLPPCAVRDSYMGNTTVTFGSAGDYYFNDCRSRVPGSGSPTIDLGAALGASNLSIRNYSGGITLSNIASGDVATIGGPDMGTVTLNGADGTVDVRGTGKPIVDNRTGSPTLTETGYVISQTTAIEADTNELQTDWTNGGRLDLIIDSIETEVLKLTTTAHSEPTGVPAANEAPIDKLGYLFMALRNQVDVTATKKTFYDDGGAAEWEKDLTDDTTTYSESEANAI